MSRVEENAALMERLPRQYTGAQDIIQTKVMMDMLAVLQDISISLARVASNFDENITQKTCTNCKYNPNNEADRIISCEHCYDFSEWEEQNG